jgi:hypothetical protein
MRDKTIDKYYNALKELEFQCKMNGKIDGQKFAIDHQVTRGFLNYAIESNIINKTSRGYEWKTGKVNMPMVRTFGAFINKQTRKKKETKQREPQKITTPKSKQKTTESISILWGLYTKTITK